MVKLDIGFGNIDVWIEANGEKLEEFGLQTKNPSKQTCYIASVENASFSVNARTTELPLGDQLLKVFVDGVLAQSQIIDRGWHADHRVQGIQVSDTQERAFFFGNILLDEDDEMLDGTNGSTPRSELGTIRVQLHAVRVGPVLPRTPVRPVSLPGDAAISEKSKKAGAHAARLGQVREVPDREYNSTTYLNEFPKHDVTFHYAPLDFLRARDIVSRGPGTEFTAAKDEDLLTVKIEGGQNTASGSTAGPSTSRPRKRGPPEVIVISDGEGSDSDDLLEGLTPEERIEFARLQAKTRNARRKGKQKARSPVVKRAKTEAKDFHHWDSNEVIVLSD